MEIAVDTNVLVSGLLKPSGRHGAVVDLISSARVSLVFDDRVMDEYERVLRRTEFPFAQSAVDDLLEDIEITGRFVVPRLWRVHLPDEKDRCFYECALEADSRILVSGNTRHFPRAACAGVTVLPPAEFVAKLTSD